MQGPAQTPWLGHVSGLPAFSFLNPYPLVTIRAYVYVLENPSQNDFPTYTHMDPIPYPGLL